MDNNEKELRRAVGRRLRLARRLVELSQEVATAAGVSRSMVALVEQGTCGIDVYRLRRMAAAILRNVCDGVPVPVGGQTVEAYLTEWLAQVAAVRVRPSTPALLRHERAAAHRPAHRPAPARQAGRSGRPADTRRHARGAGPAGWCSMCTPRSGSR
jgi:transcriptional regulator with XRE-family HTH domain